MPKSFPDNFVAFILSYGRPSNVRTYRLLRDRGYTGDIKIIVDDTDKTVDEYKKNYGENNVIVFSKKKYKELTDQGDNSTDMRSVVYARNAAFDIAKELGKQYFVELDDDYNSFSYRFNADNQYCHKQCYKMDDVFRAFVDFHYDAKVTTVAMLQSGDFIGGRHNQRFAKDINLVRKAMNFFICSVDRPFKFVCKMNDDVTTYCRLGNVGNLLVSTNQMSLKQAQTQSNQGGMTDIYKDQGTYVKSFFSVMFCPSFIKVRYLAQMKRYHHSVNWECGVPKILHEKHRKGGGNP